MTAMARPGKAATPWQAPATAPAMAAMVSQSPPSEAANRQVSQGSSGVAVERGERGGHRLLGGQAGADQTVDHVRGLGRRQAGH